MVCEIALEIALPFERMIRARHSETEVF